MSRLSIWDSLCPHTGTLNMPHSANHKYLRTEVFATIKNHKFSTCRNESHQRLFANNLNRYSHVLSEKFPKQVRCSVQISIRLQIQSKLFHLASLLKSSASSLRRNHKRKEPILSCVFSRIICNFQQHLKQPSNQDIISGSMNIVRMWADCQWHFLTGIRRLRAFQEPKRSMFSEVNYSCMHIR